MSHSRIEKRTKKYKHNNQSINTVKFGQSSPEKPNAGKPVQPMRVYLLFFRSNLFTRNDFAEHRETSAKTPEIIFLLPLEKF